MFKKKNYEVVYIINNNPNEINVVARNKKDAKKMILDVLIKCPIFEVNSKKEVTLFFKNK